MHPIITAYRNKVFMKRRLKLAIEHRLFGENTTYIEDSQRAEWWLYELVALPISVR